MSAHPPKPLPAARPGHAGVSRNFSVTLAAALALTGCATPVPVAIKPIDCPVPAALLAQRCDAPRAAPDGINYGDLLAIGLDDRKALRACAAHDQLLANMLLECQRAIKDYNQQLGEIVNRLNAKP